jgi:hypothetical protein
MMVRMPDAAVQVRNVPIKMLRGIFAGIGQLLLAADRFRAEEAEFERRADVEQHDPLTSPGPLRERATAKSRKSTERTRFRSLDSTGNVRILAAGETPPLPVPGYDGLSLPSLRSRMRSLDARQLRVLIDYEKSHAGRPDVVLMYKRRIAKLKSAESDAS